MSHSPSRLLSRLLSERVRGARACQGPRQIPRRTEQGNSPSRGQPPSTPAVCERQQNERGHSCHRPGRTGSPKGERLLTGCGPVSGVARFRLCCAEITSASGGWCERCAAGKRDATGSTDCSTRASPLDGEASNGASEARADGAGTRRAICGSPDERLDGAQHSLIQFLGGPGVWHVACP